MQSCVVALFFYLPSFVVYVVVVFLFHLFTWGGVEEILAMRPRHALRSNCDIYTVVISDGAPEGIAKILGMPRSRAGLPGTAPRDAVASRQFGGKIVVRCLILMVEPVFQ